MRNVCESSGAFLNDSDSIPMASSLMSLRSLSNGTVRNSTACFDLVADSCWRIDVRDSELKLLLAVPTSARFSQVLLIRIFLAQTFADSGASMRFKLRLGGSWLHAFFA